MKRLLFLLFATSTCLPLVAAESATASQWPPATNTDSERIAYYFQIQEMQSHMGSIMLPDPGRSPSVRAALIAHQKEFTSQQARAILGNPNLEGKRDFLPLIRREVGAPDYDPDALVLLSKLEPREARPLIIADIQSSHPVFRGNKFSFYRYPYCYLELPDQPIPELTDYFRHQLQQTPPDYTILPLIDRYGTPDLLPEVLRLYQPHAGTWACAIEEPCLRFWIRCDHAAGMAALRTSLKSRTTGCYRSLLSRVSEGRWDTDMQNLALQQLNDPDAEIVASAIAVLERSGDASTGEVVAAAYIKLANEAVKDTTVAQAINANWTNLSSGARILMDTKSFHLSKEKTAQLQAISLLQP